PEESRLLPPDFQLGNAEYFERFYEAMKDHVPDRSALENYFTAHSLWDETMAWRASEFLTQNPGHVLVIIVGDFHVAYEDGLVESLQRRNIRTLAISQVMEREEIAPHPRYGRRGDF